jgi:hypothetical protein
MRAEEGDESIKDYADEARQTRGKVAGSGLSLPKKLLRLLGIGRGQTAARADTVRTRTNNTQGTLHRCLSISHTICLVWNIVGRVRTFH